jgi:hypothetical protein
MPPVVDITETYSTGPRSFLTGWVVTRWDGYHESSTHVPAHKGEPTDVIDDDARAEWEARNRGVYESWSWAAEVWSIMSKTDWPIEDGDIVWDVVRETYYPLEDGDKCIANVRINGNTATAIGCLALGGGPMLKIEAVSEGATIIGPIRLHHTSLAKHRKRAILAESQDERLWELVFAWPEREWVARWGMFVDWLREGCWGDRWAMVGEHLANSGWQPPAVEVKHPLSEGLVSWWTTTHEGH